MILIEIYILNPLCYCHKPFNFLPFREDFLIDHKMPQHCLCFLMVQLLRFPLFRAHSFRLPADGSAPVILVGNGTGIAPFRSFWQQRIFDLNNKCPPVSSITGKRQWGDMVLFFGCRNSRLDDIYRCETEKVVHSRALTCVATAYSREKGKPKVWSSSERHKLEFCILLVKNCGT